MPIDFSGGTNSGKRNRNKSIVIQPQFDKHKQDIKTMLIQYMEHYDKKYFNMDVKEKLELDIDMNHHKLVNLSPPIDNFDAVNKSYVDEKLPIQIYSAKIKIPNKGNGIVLAFVEQSSVIFGINFKIKNQFGIFVNPMEEWILPILGKSSIVIENYTESNIGEPKKYYLRVIFKCENGLEEIEKNGLTGEGYLSYCYYNQKY